VKDRNYDIKIPLGCFAHLDIMKSVAKQINDFSLKSLTLHKYVVQ
jgi:hypothetical protein